MHTIFLRCFGLLFFLVTMNAFAGSSVISSKIEMSPGLRGGFIDGDNLKSAGIGSAKAYAQAMSVTGSKGLNLRVSGDHSYIIQNRSGEPQYYEVQYVLIFDDGQFIRKQDVVRVDNNSVSRGNSQSYLYRAYETSGIRHFTVETTVKGEYYDYARDTGSVNVI